MGIYRCLPAKKNQFYLLIKLQLRNGLVDLVHAEILEQEETWTTEAGRRSVR